MSPEELEHARCVMESHEAIKKQTGRALLAHIDAQAKQIESWRQACFIRTQVFGQVERENHTQQDQIATLKAALIEKEEIDLMYINTNCDNLHSAALQSLKLKFPEIFGEEEI
ncbi:MAG: hypothetical protein M0Q16_06870 [Candidatus Cloacimonetes bacterium]|nr:hypothetical protein [Candidatus Cloacimonadota bacterium]